MSFGECSATINDTTTSSGPEGCTCGNGSPTSAAEPKEPDESGETTKPKKPNSLSSLAQNLRRGRSLNFTNKRVRKCVRPAKDAVAGSSSSGANNACKKTSKWAMKFNYTRREMSCTVRGRTVSKEMLLPVAGADAGLAEDDANRGPKCCVCTCYRRTEEHHLGPGVVFQRDDGASTSAATPPDPPQVSEETDEDVPAGGSKREETTATPESAIEEPRQPEPPNDLYGNIAGDNMPIDLSWRFAVTIDDCEELARLKRAREIAEGVEPPANFRPVRRLQVVCPREVGGCDEDGEGAVPRRLQLVCPADLSVDSLRALFQMHVTLRSCPLNSVAGCHTQVDYVHCLVPDLLNITNCSFYWGKMDRYEAERLLDGRPEGTFLLRDSAQEEFLFSVSFRKYGRSLHARIEQWNHNFSFDSHDPSVYASRTVCGLIQHYKDPSSCMFFEPMLTLPLHRNFTFPLQHLCRAAITSRLNYDTVNLLQLPKSLKLYLKEYHYRQKVRVERFDDDVHWIDFSNIN